MTSSNGFRAVSPAQAYTLFGAALGLITVVERGQKTTEHGGSETRATWCGIP